MSPRCALACLLVTGCAAPELRPAPLREPAATTATSASSCDVEDVGPARPPERMPFGLYSASANDFAELARSGFTTVGPWYVPTPDRALLDAAAAAGLGVIFPIGDPGGRLGGAFERSAAQTREDIGARVRELADHRAIVAWYLLPEELRSWNPAELEYLRVATMAVRAADPRARPILSYQPNGHDAATLAPVVAHFDIATKGMYANYAGQRETRAWVAWSVDQLEEAGDAPAWVVPEMFEDPADADAAMIGAWVRHDVYAGLVAGARGVLVYSGFRRKGFTHYDDYMAAYRAVALELNGPLQLGDVLLRGVPCGDQAFEVVAGAREVSFEGSGKTEHVPALAQLMLLHGAARWAWLVSSSARPLTVRAHGWDDASVVSSSTGVHRHGAEVTLPAWGIAVLRAPKIASVAAETATRTVAPGG